MDRLTNIETKMADALLTIDGATTPGGYSFHSTTGSILIEDENVAMAINASNKDINYLIEQTTPERTMLYSEGANAVTSTVQYKITAQCYNMTEEQFPKHKIIVIMNGVLSDLKYIFGQNSTLYKTCNWYKIIESRRVFTKNNDIINAGNLELIMELNYSQALDNPDVNACI